MGIAYAIISYMTSYLKYYYPIEFMTAVLNNQKKPESGAIDFDSVKKYIKTCTTMGIKVSGTSINTSEIKFVSDNQNNRILFGFGLVKGLSSSGVDIIMENRPFKSFKDFVDNYGLVINKGDVIALIKSGSFNDISGSDKMRMFKYYYSVRFDNKKEDGYKPIQKVNKTHIKKLLDGGYITPDQCDDKEYCTQLLNRTRKSQGWVAFQKQYCSNPSEWEMETLNAYLTSNPFDGVKLPDWDSVNYDCNGYIGGIIISIKETTVKKGKQVGMKMAFLNIDYNGHTVDVVVFPKQYAQYKDLLKSGKCVVCSLTKQGDYKGILNTCQTLESYLEKTAYIQQRK